MLYVIFFFRRVVRMCSGFIFFFMIGECIVDIEVGFEECDKNKIGWCGGWRWGR